MRQATARVHVRDDRPRLHPPQLRLEDAKAPPAGMVYDSENYAMINRPIETGRHARRVMRYLKPHPYDRLLEVGCGRGWLTQRMQETVPATWGIDINPRSIVHAVTNQLAVMDGTNLHFEDEQFDHVYSFHAIEHIVDAELALTEMARVVKPGGRILLVYPAEPVRGLYAMPGAWMGFGNPFLARELHVHKFSPQKIAHIAARCGLLAIDRALDLFITPQFISVLAKP